MILQVTIEVLRYNPEKDERSHYEKYKIDAQPNDRVLDLLEYIKGYIDGTLSFRRSCAHGVCGSDAMRINNLNRLACKVLVQDLDGQKIIVEPLLGLRVLKDLIVDMEPFFEHYRSVMPYIVNDEPLRRSSANVVVPRYHSIRSLNKPYVLPHPEPHSARRAAGSQR